MWYLKTIKNKLNFETLNYYFYKREIMNDDNEDRCTNNCFLDILFIL